VRLYLEAMLLFGSDFDTDPQYPWATQALAAAGPATQMERARGLYRAIDAYRTEVAGPDDRHLRAALDRLSVFAQYRQVEENEATTAFLQTELTALYPEKTRFMGADTLRTAVEHARGKAQQLGFTHARALLLTSVLMHAFGHGCFADPLYPWIMRTLHDTRTDAAQSRAARLEKRAKTWLRHVLQNADAHAAAQPEQLIDQ
jgi:hypothetical protein